MAGELARRGVPVRIVDKSEGIERTTRASLVHSRTLEVFHDLGIVDEIVARGWRHAGMSQYVDGHLVSHVRYGDVDSPYPCGYAVRQYDTEEVLEDWLRGLGVTVERRTELVDLVQNEDHVRATLRLPDGREEKVDTPWLVGCDGAHSLVRHLNREGFSGEADPHQYVIADVAVDGDLARDEAHAFLGERGAFFLFTLTKDRNLVAADLATYHDAATETPTLEEIQALMDERGPGGLRVRDPAWRTYFRVHYRVADHYRHERAFLAGDAAHIHSPVGGQGMNTGIQDAYNLGWKLALVSGGLASELLLDSYETERRDVARDVLEVTRRVTEGIVDWPGLAEADRKRWLANLVVPEVARVRGEEHAEALDLDYRKSAACSEDVAEGLGAGPHAGAQVRDCTSLVTEGARGTLFDLLRGVKHTLLLFAPPHTDVLASLGDVQSEYPSLLDPYLVIPPESDVAPPPGVIAVHDVGGLLASRFEVSGPSLYLIRPDGYVGYRSLPASVEGLRAYLARVF